MVDKAVKTPDTICSFVVLDHLAEGPCEIFAITVVR
jgi:hypothetical protein